MAIQRRNAKKPATAPSASAQPYSSVSLELPMSSLVAHGRSAPKLENTVAKAGTTIRLMTAMAATMAMITKLG